MGISKQGRIYLDNQRINKEDFRNIVFELASFFDTSKASVEYRLESLGLVEHPPISIEDERSKDFLGSLSRINSTY
jgi:hypothetical protein